MCGWAFKRAAGKDGYALCATGTYVAGLGSTSTPLRRAQYSDVLGSPGASSATITAAQGNTTLAAVAAVPAI